MSNDLRSMIEVIPIFVRFGFAGAVLLGLFGGTLGLIWGLVVNPPTAWAATIELGVPAALLGGVLGLLLGGAAQVVTEKRKRSSGDFSGPW